MGLGKSEKGYVPKWSRNFQFKLHRSLPDNTRSLPVNTRCLSCRVTKTFCCSPRHALSACSRLKQSQSPIFLAYSSAFAASCAAKTDIDRVDQDHKRHAIMKPISIVDSMATLLRGVRKFGGRVLHLVQDLQATISFSPFLR